MSYLPKLGPHSSRFWYFVFQYNIKSITLEREFKLQNLEFVPLKLRYAYSN